MFFGWTTAYHRGVWDPQSARARFVYLDLRSPESPMPRRTTGDASVALGQRRVQYGPVCVGSAALYSTPSAACLCLDGW